MSLAEVTLEQLTSERPDIVKALECKQAESESAKEAAAKLKSVTEELDSLKALLALAKKREDVSKAITEAKLPKELVTDLFVTQCVEAADDRLAALITERKELAKGFGSKPQSKEQQATEHAASSPTDPKQIAAKYKAK